MKFRFRYAVLPCLLPAFAAACSTEATHRRPNIFDDEESFAAVTFSSNADSLFLSWKLTDDRIQFDSYRITDNKSQQVLTVGRDETSCLLTHVPYNEPVAVYLSLVAGGEVVKTAKTDVVIDGLDKTTAATLIPDRGSVTGGDGTYSIPLPDGRSIFLMGDSYIGPVTNGQRPTSDHMFRNTYILYDEGRVSAIYGAGGDRNASAAVPPGVSDESRKWYWPGHGFVEGNTLYVFQTVMYQGAEGMWGFRYETTDILEYELPSLTLRRTTRIPFRGSEDIHYGMAALNDGDYVYVYARWTSPTTPIRSPRCWSPAPPPRNSAPTGSTTPVRAGARTHRPPSGSKGWRACRSPRSSTSSACATSTCC